MERRDFLKLSSLAAAPLMLRGLPVMADNYMNDPVLDAMARSGYDCNRVLVIIQMMGGNDGLNTVFPFDQWSNLWSARSNILMNESSVLQLNNNDTTGLHPAMTGIRNLYNEGKVMIVQGVTYPNPSLSHFRSTDIWLSGSSSNVSLTTGWMGRALDTIFPNYPGSYPNDSMPDPLAIQIGSSLPFVLQGPFLNMGYNTSSPNQLLNHILRITDPAPNNDYGNELTFLRLMLSQSNSYTSRIQSAYNNSSNTVNYPANNQLAEQLRIVARLISGGLRTPIYVVKHPNTFDTHEYQVDESDRTQGPHADNLRVLSEVVTAFITDLETISPEVADRVTGMTFSEFGRRILSNASYGTDHGTGAPIFFFGTNLFTSPSQVAPTEHPVPGMIGVSPVIPQTTTVLDQISMQFDFRQVYATVMEDWLCMTPVESEQVLGASYQKIPIFQSTSILPVELLYFTAKAQGSQSLLEWKTASEINNSHFEIERSNDAIQFEKIGEVAGSGNSNIEIHYQFTDELPISGINYYRLKQVDYDGAFEYSNIVSVYFEDLLSISVFPNPSSQQIFVQMKENRQDLRLQIFNITGQLLLESTLPKGDSRAAMDVSALPRGTYFVRVNGDQTILTQQFVKH